MSRSSLLDWWQRWKTGVLPPIRERHVPRYFFNRMDGKRDPNRDPDKEGVELPGVSHARYEAIAFAADTLKDDSFALWDGGEVRIEVVDSARVPIFTVLISVVDDTTKISAE